jgi:cytochrome c6
MRHLYTQRFAFVITVIALIASLGFAFAASRPRADDRIEHILSLDADSEAGAAVFTQVADPSCASCHAMAAAGSDSDRAADLDRMQPDERRVVASVATDAVRAHVAQGYRSVLSDQQMADLAAYVAERAGPSG